MSRVLFIVSFLVIVEALAFPRSSPGVLHLETERRTGTRTRLRRRDGNGTVSTSLANEADAYFIKVQVGTPPQTMSLQIDTGSSDTWVVGSTAVVCKNSTADACKHGTCMFSATSLNHIR